MSRTKKKQPEPSKRPAQTIEEVLELAGIDNDDWDVLLIGDGSGTSWEKECGWGVTLITSTHYRNVYSGAFSHGTNNIAEMMAYLLPLMALTAGEVPIDIKSGCRVRVITDSQYVVNGINQRIPLKNNFELWTAIQAVRRFGIDLKAYWAPRDVVDLNRLGHNLANKSRIAQQNRISESLGGRDVHKIDPTRPVKSENDSRVRNETQDNHGERKVVKRKASDGSPIRTSKPRAANPDFRG